MIAITDTDTQSVFLSDTFLPEGILKIQSREIWIEPPHPGEVSETLYAILLLDTI